MTEIDQVDYEILLKFKRLPLKSLSLVYYQSSDNIKGQKTFAISKMDRIRSYQDIQNKEMAVIDSLYRQIKNFNLEINASYEESDIKFYLNDLKGIYSKNSHDGRYKIFFQVSNFYSMWFDDKKEMLFTYNLILCMQIACS